MYYIYGMNKIVNTIKLVSGYNKQKLELSNNDFKNKYHEFLYTASIFEVLITWHNIKIIDFIGLSSIAPTFSLWKKNHFDDNSSLLKRRLLGNFFQKALLKLRKQNYELYNLAQFIIKVIVINQLKSYTNGTTKKSIGIAMIDFNDAYNEEDFIELVLHQLTHMLLFLDDHINPHMPLCNKRKPINTTLKYKLGGTKFPAYLAFHSYIVGVEVLSFRKDVVSFNFTGNYHGNTQRIFKVCKEFKNALEMNMNLFTKTGRNILETAGLIFSNLQQQYSERIGRLDARNQ